jgi:putative transposase
MAKPRRFQDRDYSAPGWYFVTCVCAGRAGVLGKLSADGRIILSQIGDLATTCWDAIGIVRPWISVDRFVIMPDHMHGLLRVGHAPPGCAVALHVVVNGFKGAVTRSARKHQVLSPTSCLWQRSYDVRPLLNQDAVVRARRYITDNPVRASARSADCAAAAYRAADRSTVADGATTTSRAADCSTGVAAAAAYRAADSRAADPDP